MTLRDVSKVVLQITFVNKVARLEAGKSQDIISFLEIVTQKNNPKPSPASFASER